MKLLVLGDISYLHNDTMKDRICIQMIRYRISLDDPLLTSTEHRLDEGGDPHRSLTVTTSSDNNRLRHHSKVSGQALIRCKLNSITMRINSQVVFACVPIRSHSRSQFTWNLVFVRVEGELLCTGHEG